MARESIERYSRTKPDPDVLDGLLADIRYVCRARSTTTEVYAEIERRPAGVRRGGRAAAEPDLLPVDRAAVLPGDRRRARRRRARPAPRARETRIVIEKPFGYDLASAARAQPRAARGLRRVADLPDRPLPRQGDGPEPAGASGSPTRCSSRCGTATTSTASRSPPPRTSASRAAPATTRAPARCATSSRTTCSSCSRCSRSSRRRRLRPTGYATRR